MLNLRQYDHDIKEPREMENATGTSVLVRRRAHFQINGWDEDFKFYAEDDAYSMQMRATGWKIVYTPLTSGIHEDGASTGSGGKDRTPLIEEGNRMFEAKWGWYFGLNWNKPGLGVFR